MRDVPTDRRTAIHVVLRAGASLADVSEALEIDGYPVFILGSRRAGTRDGIVWTTHRQVDAVVARLSRDPEVLSAARRE